MNTTLYEAIETYISWLSKSNWVQYELYKFEFAHEIAEVNFLKQSDQEVHDFLSNRLDVKYTKAAQKGVNFLQSAARYEGGNFLTLREVEVLRQMNEEGFDNVVWDKGVATYNAMSCWSSMLFPGGNFPIFASNHQSLLSALFPDEQIEVGSSGVKYVKACQPYLKRICDALRSTAAEKVFQLKALGYYNGKPPFAFNPSRKFEQVDWNLLTEDFLYFQHRFELWDHTAFQEWDKGHTRTNGVWEGPPKIVTHQQRERNSAYAQKAKTEYIEKNPSAPCEACTKSMGAVYPGVGKGYLEAHHIEPLYLREVSSITKESDFNFLCANCHRMIHRMGDDMSLDNLKQVLAKAEDYTSC